MKMKAIAALVIPLVLAGTTVALAQQQVLIFQYSGELMCPGAENCDTYSVYEGNLLIYVQYPYPVGGPPTGWGCSCDYFMYPADPDPAADAVGVDFEFLTGEDVCMYVDVWRPQDSAEFMSYPCGGGPEPHKHKDCAGDPSLCSVWCEGTCDEIRGFNPYRTMSPTAVLIGIDNSAQITESLDISVSVFALLNPASPTPIPPAVLPQLNPEYFNPFPYPRDIPSPLRGIQIDFSFVARSIVTVINMLSEGGYLTWIAAFAVIFIVLLSFINYILKRISSGGGG